MKIKNIDVPYAQIPNNILFDPRLSWKAKGVWSYIQGKPNDWDFSSERMSKDAKDGVDSTLAAIQELRRSGYLICKKTQAGKVSYSLVQKSITGISLKGNFPDRENRPHNKERKNTKKEDNKPTKPTAFVWGDYLEGMFENKDRALNIIAHYFEYKKLSFDTIGKAQVAVKRYIKVARDVAKFDDDEVIEATKKAQRDYGDKFTIETIMKVLTK